MTDPKRVQELFLQAAELPLDARQELLRSECGAESALRRRVELLLAAHDETGGLPDMAESGASDESTVVPGNRQFEPGRVIANRYVLQQELGAGGMGEVWVAKQSEPVKRNVALKVIRTGMDSVAVLDRFEQERQALGMMDHPHIARVLDGGMTETGQPFFVMELVNGLPVSKFCDEARLSLRERLELFIPICQAVQHAHHKGVVHRDLKPANILVTLIDGKPVPKVIDFGVAKAVSGKLTEQTVSTQFGAVVGTLEYMSPEQAGYSGVDVDTRADIYSLGVILYELLTGLKPHDAKRLRQAAFTEMIRIIQQEEPSRPSTKLSTDHSLPSLAAVRQADPKQLVSVLRGELDWIVLKCLEKSRDRRYETASALSREIERYLQDEPVEARPPSMGYRFGKFARRHKGKLVAAGLLVVSLVAGIIGTSYGFFTAERQRELAEAEARNNAEAVDILTRSFESLNSELGGRGELTARDVLRNASNALHESDLDDAGRATLLHAVGNAYAGIGDFASALSRFDECLELRRKRLGETHPLTIRTEGSVGTCLKRLGREDEAELVLERALERMKEYGADDIDLVTTMTNLANCYRRLGREAEAQSLHRETLVLSRRRLGENHDRTLSAKGNVAVGLSRVNKLQEAKALYEEVIGVRRLRNKLVPESLHNLGAVEWKLGNRTRGIELLEESVSLAKKLRGLGHPHTRENAERLAIFYFETQRFEDAVRLETEVIQALRGLYPDDQHDANLKVIHRLSIACRELALAAQSGGRQAEAIARFHQASHWAGTEARVREQFYGMDEETLSCLAQHALYELLQRNFDRAHELYLRVWPLQLEYHGSDDDYTEVVLNNLVWSCVAIRGLRHTLSAELLDELRACCRTTNEPTLLSTLAVAEYRAGNLVGAMEAADRSMQLVPDDYPQGPLVLAYSNAVKSMCCFELERVAEAQQFRDQFETVCATGALKDNADCKALAEELKALWND